MTTDEEWVEAGLVLCSQTWRAIRFLYDYDGPVPQEYENLPNDLIHAVNRVRDLCGAATGGTFYDF